VRHPPPPSDGESGEGVPAQSSPRGGARAAGAEAASAEIEAQASREDSRLRAGTVGRFITGVNRLRVGFGGGHTLEGGGAQIAGLLSNLAAAHVHFGRNRDALAAYGEALAINVRLFSRAHVAAARVLCGIGLVQVCAAPLCPLFCNDVAALLLCEMSMHVHLPLCKINLTPLRC
jgi:hypothetical protein